MNLVKQTYRYALLALIVMFSIGCAAATSLLNNNSAGAATPPPSMSTEAPLSTSSADGGSATSPLAGNWNATSNLGKFLFTIDPSGENVTAVDIELNNWKCGGTLLSTQTTVQDVWPVSDSQVSIDFYLDSEQEMPLAIGGSYDQQQKEFSGSWNVDAYGTMCSGTWQATK